VTQCHASRWRTSRASASYLLRLIFSHVTRHSNAAINYDSRLPLLSDWSRQTDGRTDEATDHAACMVCPRGQSRDICIARHFSCPSIAYLGLEACQRCGLAQGCPQRSIAGSVQFGLVSAVWTLHYLHRVDIIVGSRTARCQLVACTVYKIAIFCQSASTLQWMLW